MTRQKLKQQLLNHQITAAEKLHERLVLAKNTMLVAPAGTGKTYAIAYALSQAQHDGAITNTLEKIQTFYLAPSRAKTQISRVLASFGVKNYMVMTYESLTRSELSSLFVEWHSIVRDTTLQMWPIWNTAFMPEVIIVDECQKAKTHDAQITKILISYVEQGGKVILASATPFSALVETKFIWAALTGDGASRKWNSAIHTFCPRRPPESHSETNAKRFSEYLREKEFMVHFEPAKFKHRAKTQCLIAQFKNHAQRIVYERAFDEYQRKREEQQRNPLMGIAELWVALQKFREIAEILRADAIAELAEESVRTRNKQVIIASNFRNTIRAITNYLTQDLKVPEEKISTIVGGQSEKLSQKMIDEFQDGTRDYCLFTFGAGGQALSLHHDNPEARPRHIILPPTWSGIELVQALGRAHRVTSLSTTLQQIVWYKGTVEERVKDRVEAKCRSIKEVLSKKENFIDIFAEKQDDGGELKNLAHHHETKQLEAHEDEVQDGITDAIDIEATTEITNND